MNHEKMSLAKKTVTFTVHKVEEAAEKLTTEVASSALASAGSVPHEAFESVCNPSGEGGQPSAWQESGLCGRRRVKEQSPTAVK
eukprot:m.333983 g.333983  ORF g.333983 m.333983 type:complete len:84 (-) comp16525_c0_seq2:356-607(-)